MLSCRPGRLPIRRARLRSGETQVSLLVFGRSLDAAQGRGFRLLAVLVPVSIPRVRFQFASKPVTLKEGDDAGQAQSPEEVVAMLEDAEKSNRKN
jgi:hypothetical protein